MPDIATNNPARRKLIRCAIYTRKSHEEGLNQEFNSLDAQREAAEAYIESQRMQGWRALPDPYDDGGFSGSNMDRPGLQRLLADVDGGKVDVIVVYEIDRLSRSLLDFMKMIERFNEKGISFVSVTQHFNTTDPTGRNFLSILIAFAQYEREVIAERIRDKVAAAKRRGNRLYKGEVVHKGKVYPGEQESIVSEGLWSRVQEVLSENTRAKQTKARTKIISPLEGVLRCGHCDGAMGLTYTQKGARRYTYYHCAKDAKRAVSRCPLKRVPAGDIEKVVLEQLSAVFRTPTLVSQTYFAAKGMEGAERERLLKHKERLEDELLKVRQRAFEEVSPDGNGPDPGTALAELNQEAVTLSRQLTDVAARAQAFEADPVAEWEVSEAFQSVETFWEDLFPLERNRLIRLLVEKVEFRETGIDIELKTEGTTGLIIELSGLASEARERSQAQ